MGGNAMAEFGAKRVSPDRYQQLKGEVIAILRNNMVRRIVPSEMGGKEDFGDIDVLYCGERFSKAKVQELFGAATPVARNGDCHSFLYKEIQVDLIYSKSEYMQFHYEYLSYGDRGMIIGRLARSLGYIFGHDGLWFKCGERKYLLTRNWGEALQFLGYKLDPFEQFHTEEALHVWLRSSRLFWQGVCIADSENRKKRKRDRLRPSFKRFLKAFINDLRHYPSVNPVPDPLERADSAFADKNLKQLIEADLKWDADKLRAREKFSGKHLKVMFEGKGLSDRNFGSFMCFWNDEFKDEKTKVEYVLNRSVEALEEDAREVFAEWWDLRNETRHED